ncbi:MAG: Asparagine synthetase [Candidatus Thermoplasmatota archaeon]|nr:Asparagine synthetase [Candidatus Thermoplasmatota archaeon]
MTNMQDTVLHLRGTRMSHILRVQTAALKALHDYMYENGVVQSMPVILSPETDPLNHPHFDASVEYYGQRLHLTKSMIMHKQLALLNDGLDKIYIMSPNVRLEQGSLGETGRHLFEFTQVDIELKDATKRDFIAFVDGMVASVFAFVKKECGEDLEALGRRLRTPEMPLKVYESEDLRARYGDDFERVASETEKDPFWVLNFKREFYDREDKERRGYYHNYDVFWPEGYGEALSGGEREWEHQEILRKMSERKTNTESFKRYLEVASSGLIPPTVGGGLGIERMVRFLTGQRHVRDVALFPRVPGERIAF